MTRSISPSLFSSSYNEEVEGNIVDISLSHNVMEFYVFMQELMNDLLFWRLIHVCNYHAVDACNS